MKKLLIASATLALTAGTAMADFNVSGYGRFGLNYYDFDGNNNHVTQFSGRLRMNLDASKETDSGAKFGGRIRLQWDQGDTNGITQSGAELSPAMMYVSYGGLRVEVGNAATAYDSAALLYAPEIGFQSRSYGDPSGAYFSFSSNPRSIALQQYVGIYVAYSMGDFNAKVSAAKPDQTDTLGLANNKTEYGISADYTISGFTISAAAVQNGGGIDKNDNYFVGAAYKMDSGLNVGLNYIDNDAAGKTVTLYGSKSFDAITVSAYVANNDLSTNDHDTSYGIGAGYDIGGATISGAIESGYAKGEVRGDLGVKFDF